VTQRPGSRVAKSTYLCWFLNALKAHKARQTAERLHLGPSWVDSGHVFTSTIGTPLEPRNIGREFGLITERAGLGHWHPHELRHSFASLLLEQGVAIEVVSEVLGHASIRMTADTYGHIQPAQREAAASAMDLALARPKRNSRPKNLEIISPIRLTGQDIAHTVECMYTFDFITIQRYRL